MPEFNSPGRAVFIELEAYAPNDRAAFWKFAAALCVRHAPRPADPSYAEDLRIALRDVYCRVFGERDDPEKNPAVVQLVEQCLSTARQFF